MTDDMNLTATSPHPARPPHPPFSLYRALRWTIQIVVLITGTVIGALSVAIFMQPFNIAPTGVSGVSVFLNYLFGTPVGLMVAILNIPIVILGYRYLGGWKVVIFTVITIALYAFLLDFLVPYVPEGGISENVLLNAIFAGVTGGIGTALVQRVGGTFGGTATLAVIVQRQLGTPLSTTYLYTDIGTVIIAGFLFGWESALYALIAVFISGIAIDYVLEGPSVIRIATIITDKPKELSQAIIKMGRGVTAWEARGMFTGDAHTILYVTVSRAQVNDLLYAVLQVDQSAFVVIEQGHTAYGQGFRRFRRSGM
jgi:uncharacterized membrane-anchored protein YitT (DUF2179 family)